MVTEDDWRNVWSLGQRITPDLQELTFHPEKKLGKKN
jgi:hypothetical protein